MPTEIEAKLRVESHAPVRERLRAVGAECLGSVLETNLIFDRPEGSLRQTGYGLRVRRMANVDSGESSATLTVKGPVVPGPFKSREELEINISSADTAARMLGLLGFVQVLRYQKRRESYRFGDCRIELDEPPHVGVFVEIEGPTESAIQAVQKKLNLMGLPHVKASYPSMLAAYCDEHGIADRVLNLAEGPTSPA